MSRNDGEPDAERIAGLDTGRNIVQRDDHAAG
jgi:hypothetical protein